MSGDDPSAYLRPSRTKETIDQTRMFDTKKWTWVPDEEDGFKAATIKSEKDERLTVELEDGQVYTYRENLFNSTRVHYNTNMLA